MKKKPTSLNAHKQSSHLLRQIWLIPLAAGLTLLVQGCQYDTEEELFPSNTCNLEAVTFHATIQPVLTRNCTTCHTGSTGNGGVDLSTHTGAAAAAASGRLVGAITHAQGFHPMPQGGDKLPECTINQIKKWVDAGAPHN